MYCTNHTFVICAYKESRYLEKCIESLVKQTVPSNIKMVTSTPNGHIKTLSEKYGIPLLVRNGKSDIRDDWNFACEAAQTDWVTVAHQDDCYNEHYVENFLQAVKGREKASLFITDYLPIKSGKISSDPNCHIRKWLKTPLRSKRLSSFVWVRKLILAFGNSVCCPTVAYNLPVTGRPVFTSELKYNIDWDTFLKYAKKKAPFVYVAKPLVYYRIHREATSAEFIANEKRIKDDIYMFRQFWPGWITGLIMVFYKRAYKTYEE